MLGSCFLTGSFSLPVPFCVEALQGEMMLKYEAACAFHSHCLPHWGPYSAIVCSRCRACIHFSCVYLLLTYTLTKRNSSKEKKKRRGKGGGFGTHGSDSITSYWAMHCVLTLCSMYIIAMRAGKFPFSVFTCGRDTAPLFFFCKEKTKFGFHATWVHVEQKPSYLIADQYVDACGTLFEYLVYLSGGDVKKLSDLLNQLRGRELLQVNGVVHCKGNAGCVSFKRTCSMCGNSTNDEQDSKQASGWAKLILISSLLKLGRSGTGGPNKYLRDIMHCY